jgi:hypothetical protein
MLIIDPLKNRIIRFMKEGKANPKFQALGGFGSDEDINYIVTQLTTIKKEKIFNCPRRYVLIDLTPPFERFTQERKLIDILNTFTVPRPILLVKDDAFFNWANTQYQKLELPIIVAYFNSYGQLEKVLGGTDFDSNFKQIIENDLSGKRIDGSKRDLSDLRKDYSQYSLYQLLNNTNSIELPKKKNESEDDPRFYSGFIRPYQVLKNNMMVSCYLNLKHFGQSIDYLLDVAYEIFLHIENYFIEGITTQKNFSYIITTNNTALFIASMLQAIYEDKRLIPIDKLGPIPSLRLNSDSLRSLLEDKNVILFEEVVGSGSEVDRGIMFLNHMHANINRIIALYDLQVGKSLLVNNTIPYYALCTPKEELKYEYRSK